MVDEVLCVANLTTGFDSDSGPLRAVDDVSFSVEKGKTLALVGESGCGKSVTALSILRLVPTPPGRIMAGRVTFEESNLLSLSEQEMRRVRGNRISMIFQEPMTSLNPVYTVGSQITEAIQVHRDVSKREARGRALEMLGLVGIPSPAERIDNYPHQLSGGMRQRVMIAMALSCEPSLLIADEPTTALDVTIQAQILELLARLQREMGMSILFITHDLGVVAEFAEQIVVMYAGRVIETGSVAQVFAAPRHPYSLGLLASVPQWGASKHQRAGAGRRLPTIEGVVPDLRDIGPGCRFADRCMRKPTEAGARRRCEEDEPELRSLGGGQWARCHFAEESV